MSARGTTNGNARGGTVDRRRRREWLVENYRADVDLRADVAEDTALVASANRAQLEAFGIVPLGAGAACCRCYRCGRLLTVDTVTADRIIPGCRGGTYRRNNIRPACGSCNSVTGGSTRS